MIVGSILTLGSCKNKEGDTKEETRPFSVVAQKIEENSYTSNISVSGNIEGNKTVRLGFMVAGKIDRINVNEGQNVGQGQLIATLDPSNYSIAKEITDVQVNQASDEHTYIPENQLRQIRIGQEAQVLVGALGETFTGKVTEVGGSADVTTRAFTVKIEVPNPKHNIRPGMIAEVQLAFLLHTILKWQKFLQMI